jgi:pilus assembly protein CpaB
MRFVLLVLGALLISASLLLGYAWIADKNTAPVNASSVTAPATPPAPETVVMVAAHSVASNTLLQPGDIAWKSADGKELRPGFLIRGQVPETEFVGAITRRDFAENEPLNAGDLLKLSDRRFLAAVLKPGNRAISISVDAAQTASGLMLPGNNVDVILVQNITDPSWEGRRKIVAETILKNVRVIAVDQSLNQLPKAPSDSPLFPESKVPKTVTLELTERQAEMVFVGLQLGTLQLSVRPLENAADAGAVPERPGPTWAFDVSPALQGLVGTPGRPASSGSTLEGSVRRPPAS